MANEVGLAYSVHLNLLSKQVTFILFYRDHADGKTEQLGLFICSLSQYCASEDVGLFPRTEESHSERCDSLMELCMVSAGRDSNSALR